MGFIVKQEHGIETVGQLIDSLKRFPEDMPVGVGFDSTLSVYKVRPEKGEEVVDRRGRICIAGDER